MSLFSSGNVIIETKFFDDDLHVSTSRVRLFYVWLDPSVYLPKCWHPAKVCKLPRLATIWSVNELTAGVGSARLGETQLWWSELVFGLLFCADLNIWTLEEEGRGGERTEFLSLFRDHLSLHFPADGFTVNTLFLISGQPGNPLTIVFFLFCSAALSHTKVAFTQEQSITPVTFSVPNTGFCHGFKNGPSLLREDGSS